MSGQSLKKNREIQRFRSPDELAGTLIIREASHTGKPLVFSVFSGCD